MSKRQAYDVKFKMEAIAIAEKSSNREAGRQLQIDESLVRRWRQKKSSLEIAYLQAGQAKKKKLGSGRTPYLPTMKDEFVEHDETEQQQHHTACNIIQICLSVTARTASNQPSGSTLTEVSYNDGICNIVLHNAKKRNSLSASMLDELKQNLTDASINKDVQVIILSASGPVFSAGHNLKELLAEEGRQSHEQLFRRCSEVMCLVQDIDVPVVAQVRGLATAAGCQLIASCDLTIASENAKFATPGVSIGLFCSTPAVAIARALPRKIAMQMLLTAEPITAEEALTHGLVNKVVPDEKLEETTLALAKRLCTFSRPVVALGKRCFYEQITKPRDEAYRIAESAMVHNLSYADAQEGITAFLEKRRPKWTDS